MHIKPAAWRTKYAVNFYPISCPRRDSLIMYKNFHATESTERIINNIRIGQVTATPNSNFCPVEMRVAKISFVGSLGKLEPQPRSPNRTYDKHRPKIRPITEILIYRNLNHVPRTLEPSDTSFRPVEKSDNAKLQICTTVRSRTRSVPRKKSLRPADKKTNGSQIPDSSIQEEKNRSERVERRGGRMKPEKKEGPGNNSRVVAMKSVASGLGENPTFHPQRSNIPL